MKKITVACGLLLLVFLGVLAFKTPPDGEEAGIRETEREMRRDFDEKELCRRIIDRKEFAENDASYDETAYSSGETGKTYLISRRPSLCGFAVNMYDSRTGLPREEGRPEGTELVLSVPNAPCSGIFRFFTFEGHLYLSVSDSPRRYDISRFSEHQTAFMPVCSVRARVSEYSVLSFRDKALCRRVADGGYTVEKPLSFDRLPPEEREPLRRTAAASFESGAFPDTKAAGTFVRTDFDNDGTEEFLVAADYSAGGESCSYRFLTVFNPADESLSLPTQDGPGVYYGGRGTSDGYALSCEGGRQEIIESDGERYLLSLQIIEEQTPERRVTDRELNRLDRIVRDSRGRHIEKLCVFHPHLTYAPAPFLLYRGE
ncbi:MAG: hypothetical protein ACI4PW_01435 [Alphaproteobacteria bacterium]